MQSAGAFWLASQGSLEVIVMTMFLVLMVTLLMTVMVTILMTMMMTVTMTISGAHIVVLIRPRGFLLVVSLL